MEEEAALTVQKILFADGWSRLPVESTAVLLLAVAGEQPVTREGLHLSLVGGRREGDGLDGAAWDEPHVYTDEELAKLDQEFEGTPFETRENEPRTAAEVNAAEQARRAEHRLEMQRYAQALEVPEVHTLRDLLEFFVAAGVVLERPTGELALNPHAPLPAEALPLDEEEAALQDEMRWARLHERLAQQVIGLFRPNEHVRARALQASLDQYAAQLNEDRESIRAAIEHLISEGDFAADVDLTTIPGDETFQLSVDWAQFARSRISVRRAD